MIHQRLILGKGKREFILLDGKTKPIQTTTFTHFYAYAKWLESRHGHKKSRSKSGFLLSHLEVPSGFEPLYEVLQTSA